MLLAAAAVALVIAAAGCSSPAAPSTASFPPATPASVSPAATLASITATTSSATSTPATAAVSPTATPSSTTPATTTTAAYPTPGTSMSPPGPSITSSAARNTIDFGSRTLTNNTWGASSNENLTSGVYLNQDNSFGWYWDRENPNLTPGASLGQPIFPNVRVGGGPAVKSNSKYFPLLASDIQSMTFDVEYKYQTLPTGYYNLAYEMLFSDQNQPSPNLVPKAEVMIWLHATFGQPPSSYQGDMSDGNNDYSLYSWVRGDGRMYSCFFMKGGPQPGGVHTVDVKKLLSNLSLDPSWYLLGVELGSEVVNGIGKIEISKLVLNMNGSPIKQ
jgi:hypothetical protein